MADVFYEYPIAAFPLQGCHGVVFPCFVGAQALDSQMPTGWQAAAGQMSGAVCAAAGDAPFFTAVVGGKCVQVTAAAEMQSAQHVHSASPPHATWVETPQQGHMHREQSRDFELKDGSVPGRRVRRRRRGNRGRQVVRAASVTLGFPEENFAPLCRTGSGEPGCMVSGGSACQQSAEEEDFGAPVERCGSSGEETACTDASSAQDQHSSEPFVLDAAMAAPKAATALIDSPDLCAEALARLAPGSPDNQRILDWVRPCAHKLAMAPGSCRVIQRLLEVVGGSGRDALAERLSPWTVELYESPHGNHVLTKLIEVMPSSSLRPIVERIEEKGGLAVARHQFGCRVLERLIEHCTEKEMGRLNDSFVESAEPLCRHQYGNFVVQHLIEHGASHRGAEVLQRLLPTIAQLAMHRTASHVAQTALTYAGDEGQRAIAAGLLGAAAPHSLLDVAASRYGSYVVEDLHGLRCPGSQAILDEIRRRLVSAGPEQLATVHLQRVMARFGLALAH